jgi:hypothetical protein
MTDESLISNDDRQRYKNLIRNIWKLQRLREQ